jgi:hypothetical protein
MFRAVYLPLHARVHTCSLSNRFIDDARLRRLTVQHIDPTHRSDFFRQRLFD